MILPRPLASFRLKGKPTPTTAFGLNGPDDILDLNNLQMILSERSINLK